MATMIIAAFCSVPLVLLGIDLLRGNRRSDDRHRSHEAQLHG
jgi:hypothetical protein